MILTLLLLSHQAEPLKGTGEVSLAVSVVSPSKEPNTAVLKIRLAIKPGWYVYSAKQKGDLGHPMQLTAVAPDRRRPYWSQDTSPLAEKNSEGETNLVYRDQALFTRAFRFNPKEAKKYRKFVVTVDFNACSNQGFCLPTERLRQEISIPPADRKLE